MQKEVESMATKTRRRRAGVALLSLTAAGIVLCFAAYAMQPVLRSDMRAQEDGTGMDAEVVATEAPLEAKPEAADVPAPEVPATAQPSPVLEPASFAGWDTATLDAFCAQQPSGFSVYAQDLETGEIYTYNEEIEYYPASTLKAAYALWLCQQAEQGVLDMEGNVSNPFSFGTLKGTKLSAYDGCAMIPAWDVMYAMLTVSDNNAMDMLVATWPGSEETGFCDFLYNLGFHAAYSCSMTAENGIQGIMNVEDAGLLMQALYEYFDTETSTALQLMDCFLDAEHTALYIPEGVEAAKKYGSWDYAFHDLAIVYAEHPYILCCMTDQGDQNVDFPPAVVAAMQELGQLIYAQESA